MKKIKFTLGEFIDGIEKNGLPHTAGSLYKDYNNLKSGACALGQGMWNILGQPDALSDNQINQFWNSFVDSQPRVDHVAFDTAVINLNDNYRDEHLNPVKSLTEISTSIRERFVDHLNHSFEIEISE